MNKKNKKKESVVEYYSLSSEARRGIVIIFLLTFSLLAILSFLELAGIVGVYLDYALGLVFGLGRFFIPFVLLCLSYVLSRPAKYQLSAFNYFGVGLFLLVIHGLLHINIPATVSFRLPLNAVGGGILGYLISYPILTYIGLYGGIIILVALFIVSLMLIFNTSVWNMILSLNVFRLFNIRKNENQQEESLNEESAESASSMAKEADDNDGDDEAKVENVKFSGKNILDEKKGNQPPKIKAVVMKVDLPLDLLDNRQSKPTSGDVKIGMEKIKKTLDNFHISVDMADVQVGPTVTQYTLKPAEGIKLSRITALSSDLALALAAHPIRIEAPIPGKSLVGIEVPNYRPAIVRLREIMEDKNFKERKNNMYLALGKDVSGKSWSFDLTKAPHLLVAGATGSGKSVCLNNFIVSLLYQNKPDMLRMILVDPKRVEFPVYNGIPHLLTPVITDVTKTVYALRWAIGEMDRRFDELQRAKKRNIESYNERAKEKMPFIVIIIDELADLMIAAAAEIESSIIRLTQMARAVGIHMIVATQRPSVDVITGLIKANIPTRVAFSVASLMDSRTILDSSGAEKLVGKGDMLLMTASLQNLVRIQDAYLSDEEIRKVVEFLKNACETPPTYEDCVVSKPSGSTSFDFKSGNGGGSFNNDDGGGDDLLEEAKEVVIKSGKASASLLQRRLRVGYARAARLIDLLEEAGIVGPGDGAKPREILVDKVEALSTGRMQPMNLPEDEEPEAEYEEEEERSEIGDQRSGAGVGAGAEESELEEEVPFSSKKKSGDDQEEIY